MFGLADCNNFFVSCERTRNRALEGVAVVVLSNNDGCVVARSNEAKRMGIKMGQPAFEIRDHITSGKLIALSGNHLLYREISLRVHDIFRRYAPSTQDYSVDEAFLDMSGVPDEQLYAIGQEIWRTCWEEEHIPVTIGFAKTKTLAKLVTERAKKAGEKVGVLIDDTEANELMHDVPIHDLWGIGRRLAKKMYQWGIFNVSSFADRDILWVKSKMGVVGERMWRELHGQPCIELDHIQRELQDSISETRTFPMDITDYDYIRSRVVIYASHCAQKLRAMNGRCRNIGVFLTTNRFHTENGYFSPRCALDVSTYTDDTNTIVNVALEAFDRIFRHGMSFKRAGVILSDIKPAESCQPTLFDSMNVDARTDSERLMKVLDSINAGPGIPVIKLASQLTKGHPGHNDGYSSSFQAPRKDNPD